MRPFSAPMRLHLLVTVQNFASSGFAKKGAAISVENQRGHVAVPAQQSLQFGSYHLQWIQIAEPPQQARGAVEFLLQHLLVKYVEMALAELIGLAPGGD